MSHIKDTRRNHIDIKFLVITLLGITASSYANNQYKAGLAYLEHRFAGLPRVASKLERSRMFWNWWKNNWYARDEAFLATHDNDIWVARTGVLVIKQNYLPSARRRFYSMVHCPIDLAYEISPNNVVLADAGYKEKEVAP